MNKKKFSVILCALCVALGLAACGNQAASSPTQVTTDFFAAFSSSAYDDMKEFCTASCVEEYFHDGDVNGMISARLTELGEEEPADDNVVHLLASVEMEPAESSALYPETATSFYVELVRTDGGPWQINAFPTDR